jgi:hypothetical protein
LRSKDPRHGEELDHAVTYGSPSCGRTGCAGGSGRGHHVRGRSCYRFDHTTAQRGGHHRTTEQRWRRNHRRRWWGDGWCHRWSHDWRHGDQAGFAQWIRDEQVGLANVEVAHEPVRVAVADLDEVALGQSDHRTDR